MMNNPLVSVICLCYNHRDYVAQAIESVLNQSYENIELIVVDDASTDDGVRVINEIVKKNAFIKFIPLSENVGNCQAFNTGWRAASGEYFIDLAADDILLPHRVATGVAALASRGADFGVHYCDARLITAHGKVLKVHRSSDYFEHHAPEGFIFEMLLSRYFINPVTMMFRAEVLQTLGGYDETLAYEDFDFWVRSSKSFKYCYTPDVLVEKRVLKDSHGTTQYRPGSKILQSTYRVCEKAFDLCETATDYQALDARVSFELKHAIFSLNWRTAQRLFRLRKKVRLNLTTLVS